jgi:hypothetical protein
MYGSASGLAAANNQLWNQNSVGVLDTAESEDDFGNFLSAGDFDGDGHDDLAVAAPLENLGTADPGVDVGAVNVLYGSASGLSSTNNQFWNQDSPGILDATEKADQFGTALDAGDFNGDGRVDLAVGVVYEDVGTTTDAGAVNVLYGSASGLSSSSNQFWNQNSAGILDASEPGEAFGGSLASGAI